MTVEPPKGLKSNLLRAYLSFEDDWFEEACGQSGQKQRAFRKMLFGLCFFHALIQERCNYGPLGWNIPYQFSEPDRQICVSQLRMFIEENNAIPYTALRYTAAEANYGGRVTDSHDRNTISHVLTDFYCEGILKDGYKFSESGTYYAPSFTDRQGYLEYIKSLPINQMPEAFGLHANANLSASIKEAMEILDTANSMQPKGGGSGEGGKTSDQILAESSAKYLGDLRVPFDTEYSQAMYPVDYNESQYTMSLSTRLLNQSIMNPNIKHLSLYIMSLSTKPQNPAIMNLNTRLLNPYIMSLSTKHQNPVIMNLNTRLLSPPITLLSPPIMLLSLLITLLSPS